MRPTVLDPKVNLSPRQLITSNVVSYILLVSSVGTHITLCFRERSPMGFSPRGFPGKTISRARIFDLFTIPSNGKRSRYREEDLTFPRGIKGSRVYRRHPAGDDGVRRVSPGIFHLDLRAKTERRSFIVGSSTAGRAMQQEHRKSNQTIHQP